MLKKYNKDFDYSYALGPFPTFELLQNAPEQAIAVYASSDFTETEKLKAFCAKGHVPFFVDDKVLARISDKEKCYAAGVFNKFSRPLCPPSPHVVLYNPADMGNLGTILRTLLGFSIKDLVVIEPGADRFHPKVVRASMGALFSMRTESFPSIEEYLEKYGQGRDLFPFMLDGAKTLSLENCPKSAGYTLIFGNEARGLPPEFARIGQSVFIPQSSEVDSLNLAVAVAVGAFVFTTVNK